MFCDDGAVKLFVEYHPWTAQIAVYAFRERWDKDGRSTEVLQPEAAGVAELWRPIKEHESPTTATFYVNRDDAKRLCGDLLGIHMAPEDMKDSRGEVSALKGHLEDMRRIVAKAIEVPLKQT